MHDRPLIYAGLVAFLAVVTFPVWYNATAGTDPRAPALARPSAARKGASVCVAPRDDMRASHMVLLAAWREDVVRGGQRTFVGIDGHRYEKSLTGTCLNCHGNKAQFCDRCHEYAGVNPSCGDCHATNGSR